MEYNDLNTLNRKLAKLQERLDRIAGTDASMEFRLEEEIAEIQRKLSKAYDIPYQEGDTPLREKIKQLNIEEDIGILHLVNCNRESMKDCFWDAFDEKEEEDFQFYFISACGTQMPPSFSERMIYELIHEELEENDNAIYLNRHPETGRIQFFDLPIGRKLSRCQQEFKKFFSKHFRFKDNEIFDNFITTGLPKMEYEYVALVFEISEVKWKDYFVAYFQWLIDTFSTPHHDVPKFLFFFVVYIDDLHLTETLLESKTAIVNAIDSLCSNNSAATSLNPLPPVSLADLKEWFRDIGERNPSKVQEVIDTMAKGLKPELQQLLRDKELLNMANIERVQEIVYEEANRRK